MGFWLSFLNGVKGAFSSGKTAQTAKAAGETGKLAQAGQTAGKLTGSYLKNRTGYGMVQNVQNIWNEAGKTLNARDKLNTVDYSVDSAGGVPTATPESAPIMKYDNLGGDTPGGNMPAQNNPAKVGEMGGSGLISGGLLSGMVSGSQPQQAGMGGFQDLNAGIPLAGNINSLQTNPGFRNSYLDQLM